LVEVTFKATNIKELGYEKARISPLTVTKDEVANAGDKLQVWMYASENDKKWWNVTETGWGDPTNGFSLDYDENSPMQAYVFAMEPGSYDITFEAVDITDSNKKIADKSVTIEVVAPVTNITKGKGYNTIQEAITDADAGNIVLVREGTYDEALTINEGIKLQGNNGAILTEGIEITNGDNVEIKGFTITTKGILASNITGLKIEGNIFSEIRNAMVGSPSDSVVALDIKSPGAAGPIIINNNEFDGIGQKDGTGTAIRMVKLSGKTEITKNKIQNVTKNGINIYNYGTVVDLLITDNEINNWDSDMDSAGIGGRAIRIEFNNKTGSATITENTLIPPDYLEDIVPVDPEYVKITGSGGLSTKDFDWGDIAVEKIVVN
jgi:hypothetical protein